MEVRSGKRVEVRDITREVQARLEEAGIVDGVLFLFSLHTTNALTLNEGEPGLMEDLKRWVEEAFARPDYQHDRIDRNAAAHVAASITGNSLTLPVEEGRIALGAWQRILHLELDGPRTRTLIVKVIGKK
ncbi:MAG: secondary thiamine-phosphate synthase enzyme YjbQ [Candidatus Freyarchaeota archaeon]|nr:secondary thiamine-phosphate synthase enzyme YjbQ [Candidatus Jordarchaeia archaeon]